MRRVAGATVLTLILLSIASAQASAQCMGCTSSSSCGSSSTRGQCSVSCTGTTCACLDQTCKPKPTRHFIPLETSAGVTAFAVRTDKDVLFLSACGERWISVAFAPARAALVRDALQTVSLVPPVAGTTGTRRLTNSSGPAVFAMVPHFLMGRVGSPVLEPVI